MTLLFLYTPAGLLIWLFIIMLAQPRIDHLKDDHRFLYYVMVVVKAVGGVADVLANYTWLSLVVWDVPRFEWKERTVSTHLKRIRRDTKEGYSYRMATRICKTLNPLDPNGIHC